MAGRRVVDRLGDKGCHNLAVGDLVVQNRAVQTALVSRIFVHLAGVVDAVDSVERKVAEVGNLEQMVDLEVALATGSLLVASAVDLRMGAAAVEGGTFAVQMAFVGLGTVAGTAVVPLTIREVLRSLGGL